MEKITEDYKMGFFTGLFPAWVNQPSTLQPAHKYHGQNVVAVHLEDGGFRCCLIDGDKPITLTLPEGSLSPLHGEWHGRQQTDN